MKLLLRLRRTFPRVSWLLKRPKGKLGASERPMVGAVSLLLFAVIPPWCAAQQINSSLPLLPGLALKPLGSAPRAVVVTNATPAGLEAALASGATVTFGFDGTIPLTNAIVVTTNATLDATGRSITLDGQSRVRHFVLTNGVSLRLINLTLANGRFVGSNGQTNQPGDPAFGGSIYNAGGTLELTGCKLINNQALGGNGGLPVRTNQVPGGMVPLSGTDGGPAYGGAIYSSNGDIRMSGCLLTGNTCAGGKNNQGDDSAGYGGADFGGAVYLTNATMSLLEVTFTNNVVRSTAWAGSGFGGAVFEIGSAVTISNSVFVSNQALAADLFGSEGTAQGGALFHGSGLLTMDGTLLRGNVATGGSSGASLPGGQLGSVGGLGYGGALYNDVQGQMRISNSAFVRNQANGGVDQTFEFGEGGTAYGGGMVTSGELVAINCTFAENRATGGSSTSGGCGSAYGGAIVGGVVRPVSLVNVTFAGNAVARGQDCGYAPAQLQGGSIWSSQSATATTLTNTILSGDAGQVFGLIVDGGHNICSDGSAQFTKPTSRNNVDPRLAPVADNGGPTPTVALLPGSPAIDAGDDSVCPPTDQRGVSRPQGLACDIGAFELVPQLTLRRTAQGNVSLESVFQAGYTNRFSASTNLIGWVELGTSVADTNGVSRFEDSGAAQFAARFYRVQFRTAP